MNHVNTVKPVDEVTSIKQSLVLKGQIVSYPAIEHFIRILPLLKGHLSSKDHIFFVPRVTSSYRFDCT